VNRIPPFLKWLISSILGVALLTGILVIRGDGQATPLPAEITAIPTASATASPTADPATDIDNLMIALVDSKQKIVSITVLRQSVDGTKFAIVNIDPATLIVPPGQGFVPISDAGVQGSFDGVDEAISGALGIPIDGSIYLRRLALAGLVDGVGGVTINSENLYRVSEAGEPAQYVRFGSSLLTGGQAAGYAMVKSKFETTDDFMKRTNQVLRAVLENQQGDQARVQEVLSALGSLAQSNVPTQNIARLIVELRAANLWSSASISRAPSN
jgi:anionic cell wall polymer biosynthesis LytR-Cps2A-Psr (LCP) family protein